MRPRKKILIGSAIGLGCITSFALGVGIFYGVEKAKEYNYSPINYLGSKNLANHYIRAEDSNKTKNLNLWDKGTTAFDIDYNHSSPALDENKDISPYFNKKSKADYLDSNNQKNFTNNYAALNRYQFNGIMMNNFSSDIDFRFLGKYHEENNSRENINLLKGYKLHWMKPQYLQNSYSSENILSNYINKANFNELDYSLEQTSRFYVENHHNFYLSDIKDKDKQLEIYGSRILGENQDDYKAIKFVDNYYAQQIYIANKIPATFLNYDRNNNVAYYLMTAKNWYLLKDERNNVNQGILYNKDFASDNDAIISFIDVNSGDYSNLVSISAKNNHNNTKKFIRDMFALANINELNNTPFRVVKINLNDTADVEINKNFYNADKLQKMLASQKLKNGKINNNLLLNKQYEPILSAIPYFKFNSHNVAIFAKLNKQITSGLWYDKGNNDKSNLNNVAYLKSYLNTDNGTFNADGSIKDKRTDGQFVYDLVGNVIGAIDLDNVNYPKQEDSNLKVNNYGLMAFETAIIPMTNWDMGQNKKAKGVGEIIDEYFNNPKNFRQG